MKLHFGLLPAIILLIWCAGTKGKGRKYQAKWDDLDKRALPEWYDRAKVGIFIHWGVYSVPAFGTEWFWKHWKNGKKQYVSYIKKNYPKTIVYERFAAWFSAEFFEPDMWADLFAKSGAKYVVLTSKHHDGFMLFPSKRSKNWNSVDVGPRRDIVKEVAKAVRAKGLKFGVYYSLIEWFNPLYLEDTKNLLKTQKFVDSKVIPDLKQVVQDYKPSIVWADGVWHAKDGYFKSKSFLAWLYSESPVKDEVVVNDRWGNNTHCYHGGYFNCKDRYNPGVLQSHKWENAFTIDKQSWGYRKNIELSQVLTIQQIIRELVTTVSCGGNVLINVGPTKQGTIIPIFQERLLDLGQWLSINGQAIYNSSPWKHQNDSLSPEVWYTCYKQPYYAQSPIKLPQETDKVPSIFAIFLEWPIGNKLKIKDMVPYVDIYGKIEMLGESLNSFSKWQIQDGAVVIDLPDKATVKSQYAWTLKFTMNTDFLRFYEHQIVPTK